MVIIIMASIYVHGTYFFERLKWLSTFMNSTFETVKFLIAAKGKPHHEGFINYKNFQLKFRNCDSSALKEVLYDEEYKFLEPILLKTKSPQILDLGAHIGCFTFWCSGINNKTKSLLIEANPTSYKILKDNLELNIQKNNWIALNRAAWLNDNVVKLDTRGDTMGNALSDKGETDVTGINLQEILDHLQTSNIDIVKIDIEGAEERFFECVNEELLTIKNLVIELHPQKCDISKVVEKLNTYYKNVVNLTDRIDSKPLLHCYN